MADVCAKCGASLTSTSGVCSSCGAPIGTAIDSPRTASGGALKTVFITVAIVLGVGILAAGAIGYKAWRAPKPVAANGKTNDALFSIPGLGSISTGSDATADPTQLGAPIYPGAAQEKGAVAVGTAAAGVAEAHFTSGDPVSQVVAFYESNMPGAIIASTAAATVLNSGPSVTDRVTVTITAGSGSNAGKTAIVIVRTTKN
jgi:hypothetical protein